MKFINQFKSIEELNTSINSIKHKDYAYIFNTIDNTNKPTFYDQRHPGGRCIHISNVNMNALSLDKNSVKNSVEIGDILYATNSGTLTLDESTNNIKNTPIAICAIPNVLENQIDGTQENNTQSISKFVSLNYMDYANPTEGNKIQKYMYFGNYNNEVGADKGYNNSTIIIGSQYIGIGGKFNTQKCIDSILDKDQLLCDGVNNTIDIGNCPPVLCCNAYNTLGTNPGDWYLPSNTELLNMLKKYDTISPVRKTIVGEDYLKSNNLYSICYWASTEVTGKYQYVISIDSDGFCIFESASKNRQYPVLAFLNVII